MSFSTAWDETSPPGSQDISLGDDRIREFKTQMRERLSVDHHIAAADDANTGYHEKTTLINQGSDPAQVSGALILYAKTFAGVRELVSCHETAALQQLTLNGKLWISALSMAGITAGDIFYFDGTIVNRLSLGTALQQIRTNAGATAPEWFTPAASFVSGMIMLWSGTIATIPAGWVLCNGSNSTPDLRDKFVIGANQDSGGVAKSQVEGSLNQSSTDTNGNLQPPQTHQGVGSTGGAAGGADAIKAAHTHIFVPPYYALAYIMKS